LHRAAIVYFFITLMAVALFAVSCKTAEFGFKVIDVNGMVYDFSNRPVPFCEVTMGKRFRSSTDINGRFAMPKVPVGTYTITGTKKGFESYSEEVIIKDRGQIVYFRMPSQSQLLTLIDEALSANNLDVAEEMAERAYRIDDKNIEMLFYYATVKFRQNDYIEAIVFLEIAKRLGSKDFYIDKFLTVLKELRYAE